MKHKKLLAGAVVTALVLSTGVAVYACEPQISDWFTAEFVAEGNIDNQEAFSFDSSNLPEGVEFKESISNIGSDEVISFDEKDLPNAVQFVDEINLGGTDVFAFDENNTPDGTTFKEEISVANGNSSMSFE